MDNGDARKNQAAERLKQGRARTNETLRSIIEATANTNGGEFLHTLVQHLASSLDCRYAFAGEVSGEKKDTVQILALWAGGAYAEPFSYGLKGTPCENVVGKNLCYHPSGVQELFPKDHLLGEMGIESYIGVPLFDTSGAPIGIIAAMNDRPMSDDIDAPLILSTFASRAGIALERKIAGEESRKLNTVIEKKVRERTANLESANQALHDQIVERIKAEEALRQSEELYRTLTESAHDLIYLVDRERRVQYMNRSCARFLGSNRDDLMGRPIEEVFPHGLYVPLSKKLDYVFETGKPLFEEEGFRFNGSEVCLGTRLNPIIIKGSGVNSVLGISRDITERMRWTRELKNERDRAQTYLDIAGVMIVILDSLGRITLINRKGAEILGYGEKELLGRDWFDTCLPERDRGAVKNAFLNITGGKAEMYEYFENPVLTRSGDEKIIAWKNSVLLGENGAVTGVLSSGEDITERKRRDDEREKLITDLTQALSNIKTLKGLLPICASCKKIRDDRGYWRKIEVYIQEHSEADFSHGICPECSKKLII